MTLSIEPFLAKPNNRKIRQFTAALIDRLLGIKKLSELYYTYELENAQGDEFLDKVIQRLNVNLSGVEELRRAIPATGPVVIAANHPFGGLEGVLMLHAISAVRPDVKVLANFGLSLFPQMKKWSIFTNPLQPNNPKNVPSLRQSKQHLAEGGALLLFPAGRVSYYHKDKKRIADHDWNRLIARFCRMPNVKYCPVFISGENSKLFYRLGRVWYRFRLLMLTRELTNKHNASVALHATHSTDISKVLSSCNDDTGSAYCRALAHIHDPKYIAQWPATEAQTFAPIAEPIDSKVILEEAASLPAEQQLYAQGNMVAYYAAGKQIPNILHEITRRREIVFRMHNEGSGKPIDSDHFDYTYTHLFVVDQSNGEVAGAYRMGQTDKLLAEYGQSGLYLAQMFNFKPNFINQTAPCLEMGRSFLMPAYQKSRLGLFMLWRAIGEFVIKHPQYRVLYGTVSLSKMYDKRSIKLIEQLATTPTNAVVPHAKFDFTLSPEADDFIQNHTPTTDTIRHLESWLSIIEPDQKKLPVLLRQYASMGATFHCLGVDKNFADTPGLLLSVDLAQTPEKRLKQFLGPNWAQVKQ